MVTSVGRAAAACLATVRAAAQAGRWLVAVAAALLLVAGSVATPAGAAPIERERFSGTETGTEFTCGVTYEFEVTFSGLFMLKAGRRGDPTPYFFEYLRFRDVHHDADGRGWILEGHGLDQDLQITHVEGTVYRFVGILAGQPLTIRTLDGRVVLRDRGVLRFTVMVDTKGDSDLSNDEFIEGSFEVLRDAGSHTGLASEEAFCAAVEAAVQG